MSVTKKLIDSMEKKKKRLWFISYDYGPINCLVPYSLKMSSFVFSR